MSTVAGKKVFFALKHDQGIRLEKEEKRGRNLRLALASVVTALTLLTVFLVSFGFLAKIANGGYKWTWRAPLVSGLPETNDYVLASDTGGGLRANTRIFESLFRQHDIVKIVGVPGDDVSSNGGLISINGKSTGYTGTFSGGQKLSAKYLVLCREGACQKDTLYTIPTLNVLGQVNYDEPLSNKATNKW